MAYIVYHACVNMTFHFKHVGSPSQSTVAKESIDHQVVLALRFICSYIPFAHALRF